MKDKTKKEVRLKKTYEQEEENLCECVSEII